MFAKHARQEHKQMEINGGVGHGDGLATAASERSAKNVEVLMSVGCTQFTITLSRSYAGPA